MSKARGRGVLALTLLVAAAWWLREVIWAGLEVVASSLIRRRLKGYRVRENHVDTTRPTKVQAPHRVAVIGAGLAGVSAAVALAERGVEVVVFEREPYLGGKLGAWEHRFEDGSTAPMEHGFHAFFGNYYNLNRFLRRLGIEQKFVHAKDYLILLRDGASMSFKDLHRVPGLNLLHLATRGFFSWRELVINNPGVDRLNDLLNYEPKSTFQRLDNESYAAFADAAGLPAAMRLIFKSFTRVFFAEPHQMSMAELAKSFHGFFLSHDHGLVFRHPTDDHGRQIWGPVRQHLDGLGVHLRLGKAAGQLARKGGRWRVGREAFDEVVLATDVRGALRVLEDTDGLGDACAQLTQNLRKIQPANRYAVLRVWLDKDVKRPLPHFTSTDRIRALDSITLCHRYQEIFADVTGSVIELHSYCVPASLTDDQAVRDALFADMIHYLPELRSAAVVREIFYQKDDFTPYFVGMDAFRPRTASGIEGLWLAGDWVKQDAPVMLMEAAFTSGLLAANAISAAQGVQEEPIYSVPKEGLLFGVR